MRESGQRKLKRESKEKERMNDNMEIRTEGRYKEWKKRRKETIGKNF